MTNSYAIIDLVRQTNKRGANKMAIAGWNYDYQDVVSSMTESLAIFDMRFVEAWNYELANSVKSYGKHVRVLLADAGKTLADLLSDLEDAGVVTNENYYKQPFDYELEKELGYAE
jgi:hypothetical protein